MFDVTKSYDLPVPWEIRQSQYRRSWTDTAVQAGSKQTACLLPTSKFTHASNPHTFSSPSAYGVGQTSQDIQSCKRPIKIIASKFWIHTVLPKVQSIFLRVLSKHLKLWQSGESVPGQDHLLVKNLSLAPP